MKDLYYKLCQEEFDGNGVLTKFKPTVKENFNFGYDVLDEIANDEPNRRALLWCNTEGDERTFTYGELSELSNKTANVLANYGIGKGDMVMMILKRHYQFWYVCPALHKLGVVAIPATNLLTQKDLEYRFKSAGVKAVICTGMGDVHKYVLSAAKNCGVEKLFMINGSHPDFIQLDEKIEEASPEFTRIETKLEDPMLLYFTSGTTGHPKMVLHNFLYPIGHMITARHWQNVDPNGIHLTVAETGWGKAVWGKLYGQWIMGTTVFVYDFDKFVPHDMLSLISKHKITSFCAPPTMFRFFIKEGLDKYDLSSLKHTSIAGEALNPEVFNKFKEYTGLELMEGFGQTETTVVAATLVGMKPKPGSMGKPSPLYDVDLIDEEEKTVPPGEIGEIVVRIGGEWAPGLFHGYYLNQELTDSCIKNGIYHTGDTAWRDEDGYLWYVGRTDDVIKASGYRIGPFEIESVLMEHPCVLECAVTGAEDPIRGVVVKATIVLAKNYEPSDELKKEIQDFAKKQTAPYKYPRIVEFVTELPKTISGKIKRAEIRKDGK